MLRADNDKLRLRIKSMKEAQDSKDEVLAGLRAKALCAEFTGTVIPRLSAPRLSADLDYPRFFGPKSVTPNFIK